MQAGQPDQIFPGLLYYPLYWSICSERQLSQYMSKYSKKRLDVKLATWNQILDVKLDIQQQMLFHDVPVKKQCLYILSQMETSPGLVWSLIRHYRKHQQLEWTVIGCHYITSYLSPTNIDPAI